MDLVSSCGLKVASFDRRKRIQNSKKLFLFSFRKFCKQFNRWLVTLVSRFLKPTNSPISVVKFIKCVGGIFKLCTGDAIGDFPIGQSTLFLTRGLLCFGLI